MTERLFAVGDIHGCFDKLISLMDMLEVDMERDTLLFIGDYIDRGPDSKKVVDYLIDLDQQSEGIIFLKGNHELMLENFLNGTDVLTFMYNGGQATLDSYARNGYKKGENLIPPSHLEFFGQLRTFYETDDYIFVHGGLKPNLPLQEQEEWDMLWIRDEFITSGANFGKRVVFGHTPFREPLVMDNKIGIDTGAVYGNRLTCVELPALEFFSV